MTIRSILVVCVGNICRSPMAEMLLRAKLDGYEVSSAGLGAMIGHSADPHAVELMSERGHDISAHRAKQLVDTVSRRADLILVMEERHRKDLETRYPYTCGRVFRLGHFDSVDIADPFRHERSVFESSLKLIERAVEQWAQRIHRLF